MLTAEMDAPVAANGISAEIDILLTTHGELYELVILKPPKPQCPNLMGPIPRIVQ